MSAKAHIGRAVCCALVCALALAGCAAPAPKNGDVAPLVWPDVPNPPRIAYVKAYSKPDDFGIAKGFWQRLAEVFLGANDARLMRPMAVLESAGVIYVADPGASGVHRFDAAGARYDLVVAENEAPLPSPVGLARGAAGDVYVTDSDLAQVFVIRRGAKSAVPLPLAGLGQPTGIAFDAASGRLYVTDTAAHRIAVFGRDGRVEFTIGARGDGDGEFNYPTLIWLDPRGRLYVTDTLNFRVQVFAADGKFIGKFGRAGDSAGDSVRPKGVATDSYGHVYVVDGLHSALQIFDQQGRYLLSVGELGGERGEFWLPTGIFIGEGDFIYIADSYNQRIQVFRYIGGAT